MLLLLPGFSSQSGPQDFTALLLPPLSALLQDHLSVPRSLGSRFEPRPFSGSHTSTGELLRTL